MRMWKYKLEDRYACNHFRYTVIINLFIYYFALTWLRILKGKPIVWHTFISFTFVFGKKTFLNFIVIKYIENRRDRPLSKRHSIWLKIMIRKGDIILKF